jgi:general secretion pathway protein D
MFSTRGGRALVLLAGAALAGAALAGCAAQPPAPKAQAAVPQAARPLPAPEAADSSRVSGAAGSGVLTARPSAAISSPAALSLAPAQNSVSPGGITLDFASTDIHTVVEQILGGLLRQNYTIDPDVTGTATLHTVTPLSRADLLPTLQTLLAGDNAVLLRQDGIYRVMRQASAEISSVVAADAATGGDTLIQLRYADPVQLVSALRAFVKGGGRVVAFESQNAVIVEGDPATRQALTALIKAFDVDELAGQSYEIFPVSAGGAKDFAAAFSAALAKTAKSGAPDTGYGDTSMAAVSVVPLERINAVLVVAKNESLIFNAQRVYAVLNQQTRETLRGWHVYYLRNGRANDAAYVLQQAFTPDDVTAQPTSPATGQPPAGFNSQDNSSDSGAGTSGLGASTGVGGIVGGGGNSAAQTATPAATDTDQTGGAAPGPLAAASGTTNPDAMRIVPDIANNSLLIYGTEAEDDQVDAMLEKIDISPVEVRIDAIVAEVDLNNALQYGTQFFFKSGGINAVLSNGTTSSLATNFPGFVLSGDGSDAAPAAISALQAVTTVRILTSPELLVMDGQAASLQVGNDVPYLSQTEQSTTTAGAPVVNSIDYRETGVNLQVTPHVGNDDVVTLDVAQEVSGVQAGVTTAGIDSPTFSDRAVTSRIAVADGQTIGLAGLISDNDSRENSGIPFLKNLPLIGDLADSQDNSRKRTELLVLITPYIIRTQNDADALTADLREELPGAAAVPAALQTAPPSEGADPDAALRTRIPGSNGD